MYKYGDCFLDVEADIYYKIKNGISSFEKEIKISKTEYKNIRYIFDSVKLDFPETFYVADFGIKALRNSESIILIPNYLFSEKQANEISASLKKRAQRILKPAIHFNEIQAVDFVRKWIFQNVEYQMVNKSYSHEIYGVLSHGIGVCEGIAKTVKYMLSLLDIDSVVVIGSENEQNVRHAWNLINVYGKYKHFDITFDMSRVKRQLSPIYSLMNDKEIYKDHNRSIYKIPECL